MYRTLLKPLLFQLDAENAHHLVFNAASLLQALPGGRSLAAALFARGRTDSPVTTSGLTFPNRVGVAAGFDKNARIPALLMAAGFGHVEIGSLTARPSPGNPKPRLFRLPADRALINRMGLNNDGAEIIAGRVQNLRPFSGIAGLNIAKTHDPSILGDAAIRDYLHSFEAAVPAADYVMVNISCPNTTEGKTFEDPAALRELLAALRGSARFPEKPVFLKLSADLQDADLEILTGLALEAGIRGFAAVNTSVSREGLRTPAERLARIGRGGLSGAPLVEKSRRITGRLRSLIPAGTTLISVGGIDSADEARRRLDLGADLVQVYSALVYEGPGLGGAIARALA